jgi:hypothetical protein
MIAPPEPYLMPNLQTHLRPWRHQLRIIKDVDCSSCGGFRSPVTRRWFFSYKQKGVLPLVRKHHPTGTVTYAAAGSGTDACRSGSPNHNSIAAVAPITPQPRKAAA